MPDGSPVYTSSVAGAGTVSAPTLGATIATIASGSLPVGLYDVEVWSGMNGTLSAGVDTSNMGLKVGNTTVIASICNVVSGTSNPSTGPLKLRLALDGASAITVFAVAAANAGSRYTATILATKVS